MPQFARSHMNIIRPCHAALEQTEATDSGLRYHAALGLVGNAWEDVRQRVAAIATA